MLCNKKRVETETECREAERERETRAPPSLLCSLSLAMNLFTLDSLAPLEDNLSTLVLPKHVLFLVLIPLFASEKKKIVFCAKHLN